MQSVTGEYKLKITNLAVIILIAFNLLYLISPYDNNFPCTFFLSLFPKAQTGFEYIYKISNAMCSVGAISGSL